MVLTSLCIIVYTENCFNPHIYILSDCDEVQGLEMSAYQHQQQNQSRYPGVVASGNLQEQQHQERYQDNPPAQDGLVECLAVTGSMFLFIITLPFSLFFCFKIAHEFERLVCFRLGRIRFGGPRGPGLVFVLPCIDAFMRIDLRTESFDVPCQEVRLLQGLVLNN